MLCDLEGCLGLEVGSKFKREGTYVYLWLIHVVKWQKPIKYYKAIIPQLKIIFKNMSDSEIDTVSCQTVLSSSQSYVSSTLYFPDKIMISNDVCISCISYPVNPAVACKNQNLISEHYNTFSSVFLSLSDDVLN